MPTKNVTPKATAAKPKATKALVPVVSGEVVAAGSDRLTGIADDIRAEYGKGVEAQFAIGRLLGEAWDLFGGDKVAYGHWCQEQELPFHRNTAQLLRIAASREDEVRAYIAEANDSNGGQRDIGVISAVKELVYPPKPAPSIPSDEVTPVDPAYDKLRSAVVAICGTVDEPTNAFLTMHVDDLSIAAGYIMQLADAYKAAKKERSA